MKCFLLIILILFSSLLFGQSKLNPYFGLHISMDAGGYYLGPSFQIGLEHKLKQNLAFSTYFQYFYDGLYDKYPDGSFDWGKYKAATFAFLLQRHLTKDQPKRLGFAGGLALQRICEVYQTDQEEGTIRRFIPVAVFRINYLIPLNNRYKISVELNGTGPSSYHIESTKVFELLTQLSLGLRILL